MLIGLELNGVIGDVGEMGEERGELFICLQSSRLVTSNSEVTTK
jgi:hypothetical protein